MSPAPRLRLAGVTVTYPDGDHRRTVLDHIEFEAGAGEFVGVSGPSGSGKSTLLAVAGALLRPDSGQVWLDTAELTSLSREKAAKLRRNSVGFVFQDANLLPSLSALDQLLFTCALAGTRPGRHRARAQQLLDDVGLTDRTHMRPDHLSGGERQRVAIARALINNPAILLVDEPTASIDATQTSGIVRLLADQAHRHHCALIMVTHDPAALSACDRTTTITALAAPSRP